jgi:hypothetical protein
MPRDLDFTGLSGTLYRYQLHEDDRPPSPAGGNYLYVKTEKGKPVVLYAGETESLYRGWNDRWSEARQEHGASQVYMRLNITGHVRRAERDDLAGHYQPVMNKAVPAPGPAAEDEACDTTAR